MDIENKICGLKLIYYKFIGVQNPSNVMDNLFLHEGLLFDLIIRIVALSNGNNSLARIRRCFLNVGHILKIMEIYAFLKYKLEA